MSVTARLPADPEAAAAAQRQRRLIGCCIRQARQRLGLSQERLAHRLEVSRAHVNRWERGVWAPNALHLEQLAETLEEEVHYFFGGPSRMDTHIYPDADPFTPAAIFAGITPPS